MVGQLKKTYLHRPIKTLLFSHTYENSKMFNITSKYFSFFNNKPSAGWVTHIARDFLTCYSCLYIVTFITKTGKEHKQAQTTSKWPQTASKRPQTTTKLTQTTSRQPQITNKRWQTTNKQLWLSDNGPSWK